uniref:Uncharacterized protein n=1 Tax=Caenorhabditis tropicalis TaxID=1561998 RepID=A0A1I7TNZ6_9PELO
MYILPAPASSVRRVVIGLHYVDAEFPCTPTLNDRLSPTHYAIVTLRQLPVIIWLFESTSERNTRSLRSYRILVEYHNEKMTLEIAKLEEAKKRSYSTTLYFHF